MIWNPDVTQREISTKATRGFLTHTEVVRPSSCPRVSQHSAQTGCDTNRDMFAWGNICMHQYAAEKKEYTAAAAFFSTLAASLLTAAGLSRIAWRKRSRRLKQLKEVEPSRRSENCLTPVRKKKKTTEHDQKKVFSYPTRYELKCKIRNLHSAPQSTEKLLKGSFSLKCTWKYDTTAQKRKNHSRRIELGSKPANWNKLFASRWGMRCDRERLGGLQADVFPIWGGVADFLDTNLSLRIQAERWAHLGCWHTLQICLPISSLWCLQMYWSICRFPTIFAHLNPVTNMMQ